MCLLVLLPVLSLAISTTLVISEYMAAGATASDEFIELKNISASPIDLGDYKLQYYAVSGNPGLLINMSPGTILPAGKTYLLGGTGAGATYAAIADQTYVAGMAANGQLAIQKVSDSSNVDAVAWGAVTVFAAGNTDTTLGFPATPQTASRERKPAGVNTTDTDSNLNDFIVQATPSPTALGVPHISGLTQTPFVPNAAQSVTLSAIIVGSGGHTISSASVSWSLNGANQTPISMSAVNSTYSATIPGQVDNSVIRYTLTAMDNVANSVGAQGGYIVGTTSIAFLRPVDGNGVAVYAGLNARSKGVATMASGTISTTNLQVFMQDNSGSLGASGINVFSRATTYTVAIGNNLVVEGIVTDFSGLLELDVATTTPGGSIAVQGSTTPPAPMVIPSISSLDEAHEGLLVKIADVYSTFTASSTGSANYSIYRGGNPTLTGTMRINISTGISTPPTYPVAVTGIVGQSDFSSPETDGYQLIPRSTTDFAQTLVVVSEQDLNAKLNEQITFTVTGGTGPYSWSVVTGTNTGTLNTTSGSSVTLTVGTTVGYLYVKVQDAGGLIGTSGLISASPTYAPMMKDSPELYLEKQPVFKGDLM